MFLHKIFQILVYKGAEEALLNTYKPTNYFGSDGFGDFKFTEKVIAKVDKSKHAAVALVDLVKANPGWKLIELKRKLNMDT